MVSYLILSASTGKEERVHWMRAHLRDFEPQAELTIFHIDGDDACIRRARLDGADPYRSSIALSDLRQHTVQLSDWKPLLEALEEEVLGCSLPVEQLHHLGGTRPECFGGLNRGGSHGSGRRRLRGCGRTHDETQ